MRAFEWLLVFSFLPILLTPFIPKTWRRRWLMIFTSLPALVGGLHLVVEGWRIQMLPLYVLAVLVLLSRLPLLRYKGRIRRGHTVLVSIVYILWLIASGVLAGWLLPVISLPKPTGPYPVGIVDRELVDNERGRRLMASVWYPAEHDSTPAPLTHYPNEVTTALGSLSGLPGILLQHLRYFTLDAGQDVPLATSITPFPVLVFSHGMVGLRLQNSSTLQNLASWGYIVVAIDHTDAAAVTVFPDGEARFYNLGQFGISADMELDKETMNERVFPVWVSDQQFVYNTLEVWEANDPLLAGKLDLTRIGSFGHSFGGATALEVCRIEVRCRAVVNMDGGLYGNLGTQPAVRPLLLMSSAESSQFTNTVEAWQSMIENADAAAYWLELPNSSHFSFTITQLLSPFLVPPDFNPHEGLHIVDKYLRAFFDIHLREMDTVPLEQFSDDMDVHWIHQDPQNVVVE